MWILLGDFKGTFSRFALTYIWPWFLKGFATATVDWRGGSVHPGLTDRALDAKAASIVL